MKKILFVFLLLMPVLCAQGIAEKVQQFTLDNGMKFYVYERPGIPTFAGLVMAKVGSVDEEKGETGLAHFFEHLAFKGTPLVGTKDYAKEQPLLAEIDQIGEALVAENNKGAQANTAQIEKLQAQLSELHEQHRQLVVKDEFDQIYSENGSRGLNARTDNDTTTYMVMLPTDRLELWFLMESERFKHPVLREFYLERDVIAEERRMYDDNDANEFLGEEFLNIAFVLHPYCHSIVGYMEDIQNFTRAKAMAFYKKFYIPNNLSAALVGNVKFDEVKRLAQKYFGDIPAGPVPPRTTIVEPRQKGERRVSVEFDAEPQLMLGYHMPAYGHQDNTVLTLISMLLTRGNSSRLVRELVTNRKLAVSVSADTDQPGSRYPSLFAIHARTRHPHTPEELERAIYQELDKLKNEPVSAEELSKVINQFEALFYSGMNNNLRIALRILYSTVLFDDLDSARKSLEEMKRVTPEHVMDTARRIFVSNNRTVGILHKKEKGK